MPTTKHSLLCSVKKWYYWTNFVDDNCYHLSLTTCLPRKNFFYFSKEWVSVLGKYFFNRTGLGHTHCECSAGCVQ
jgi:hypothetical protein